MLLITLIIAILMLVVIYIPAFVAVSLVMVKKADFAEKINNQPLFTVFIIIPVVLAISLLIIFLVSGGNIAAYGIIPISAVEMVFYLLIGLLIAVILQAITELIIKLSGEHPEPELLHENPRNRIIIAISMVFLPSIGEELVFRGLIQTWIDVQEGFSYQEDILITPGIVTGAVLFGIIHLGLIGQKKNVEVVITVIMAMIIGACAGLMYSYSGSIIPAVIIHAGSNLIGVVFNLIKIRKENPLL